MKDRIGHLYLVWRKGVGSPRYVVGVIKRSVTKGVTFEYLDQDIEKAESEGFRPYTEFPKIDTVYSNNILEIFGQRLIKDERRDKNTFYKFWEIDEEEKDDTYTMLAKTMGLVPTDNFEFLAAYHPVKDLHFISEIAGLSHLQLKANTIKEGDELLYEFEANREDQYAVRILNNDGLHIGYVKKVHNRLFRRVGRQRLKITVKAVDQNGVIKRVFIKVCMQKDS